MINRLSPFEIKYLGDNDMIIPRRVLEDFGVFWCILVLVVRLIGIKEQTDLDATGLSPVSQG
jgi:hypothetical protein